MTNQSFDTEDHLLVMFQNGDEGAFNQLYRKLYPALCFFAVSLISDKSVSEEIVQDTLFIFWKKKTDFNNFKAAKAFVYVSVKNACLNHLDKENRKEKKVKDLFQNTVTSDQPFVQKMVLAEVLNELRLEVARLPEQCAKVIKMLYEEDMKPQQIADELNITVSTVYNQKLRGISLLKKRIPTTSLDSMALLIVLLKCME